jgi:hypothetical protein
MLFGTLVAETILASAHVRAHRKAGHMDASDLIKALQNTLRGGGRPHMGRPHVGDAFACEHAVRLRRAVQYQSALAVLLWLGWARGLRALRPDAG